MLCPNKLRWVIFRDVRSECNKISILEGFLALYSYANLGNTRTSAVFPFGKIGVLFYPFSLLLLPIGKIYFFSPSFQSCSSISLHITFISSSKLSFISLPFHNVYIYLQGAYKTNKAFHLRNDLSPILLDNAIPIYVLYLTNI
jgi:hypothetical protein